MRSRSDTMPAIWLSSPKIMMQPIPCCVSSFAISSSDLFAFDVTTPPPLNFRMVAAFMVFLLSSGHGSPLSANALKTRRAAEIVRTCRGTFTSDGQTSERLRCYIRAARHVHLNRLCGIGRYLRREHADFVCLRGQHAKLFAQKGRLQFDHVGEVLGAC